VRSATSAKRRIQRTTAIPSQAISRPADLWLLGRHRVLCGNALEQSAYADVMESPKAQLIFTDPPYNVGSSPSQRALSTRSMCPLEKIRTLP
jgi:DNA modification methylase